MGRSDDGTSRQVFYGVSVLLDGLTSAQLEQLLGIVADSAYDGGISDGRLVLVAERS